MVSKAKMRYWEEIFREILSAYEMLLVYLFFPFVVHQQDFNFNVNTQKMVTKWWCKQVDGTQLKSFK